MRKEAGIETGTKDALKQIETREKEKRARKKD